MNIFIHDNNGVTDQPIIAFEHYMIKISMIYRKPPIITKNQYFKGIPIMSSQTSQSLIFYNIQW